MSFEVSIIEFPAKHLIGMKVATNMQKAQADCPTIWHTFGPRMAEVSACDCGCSGAYGISIMHNENDFDYWAAVAAKSGAAVPSGMGTIDITAGAYAKCTVPNLKQLGEVYMYVYTQWVNGQKEYGLNMQAPCFELYPTNWQPDDSFEIYVPVVKQ
ncbi:MAG: GyrI-like domain-containing protein [Thermoguttaceae bacterium]